MALPATRDEYRKLSGVQKAAIFIMSVGEETAGKIFSQLQEDEIRDITHAISTLGQVNSDVIERLFSEFMETMGDSGNVIGSYDMAERLLTKALGKEKVASIMEEIRGPAGRTTWDKLGNVSEEVLASYLKNEYPQTVSLVLSRIKPDHAAKVLTSLPEEFAMETILRMLTMDSVKKEVMDGIESTLRTEFMNNLAKTQVRDSFEIMAEIFNNFDRSTEFKFFSQLENKDKDSAEKIRSLMFTFEDLLKIDAAGVQVIVRNVDKDKLGTALKGASEKIRDLFFSNMSERAAKIMREDMEAMGPVRLKDVDEAQMYIVTITKDLANKGEVVVADNGGEEQMVY